jgi:hypothetical protein
MKTAKQEAIELIQKLPDETSWAGILAEMHFRLRVLHGIEQADRGRVVSNEEAKKQLSRWLTSSGPTTQSRTSTE